MDYEAVDYTQKGLEEFYKSIHNEKYLSELCWYGAFIQKHLVEVIATRNAGTHIALTSTFCLSDDRVYENMCGITFEQHGTIERGMPLKGDFYFYRS